MAGKQTYGALNNSRCSPLGMDGDRYIVWVTNRLFQKRARQPWAVRWWERHAPFLGKQVLLFLGVRECPRPFSPFLSFLIHSFPSLLYSLLPVWTYTLMQTDINTQSHWWPMWCLVSICASSFPLLSLSLPYDWRQEVRWHVDLRCHWLHLSLVLFVLGMWSLTTRWEVIYYQDMRWLFFTWEGFMELNGASLLTQTCVTSATQLIPLHPYFCPFLSFSTFPPPPFHKDWI